MSRGFGVTRGSALTDRILTPSYASTTLSTFHIIAKRDGAGGDGGVSGRLFEQTAPGNFSSTSLLAHSVGSAVYLYARGWSGAVAQWTIPEPSASVFHAFTITYDGGSTANDALMYVDGVSQTVTRSVAPSGSINSASEAYLIGNRDAGSAWDRSWNGDLAEFAYWNVILTPDECAALGKGMSPLLVRPQSLLEYVPMLRDNISRRTTAPTVTGTAVQPHPRVANQKKRQSGYGVVAGGGAGGSISGSASTSSAGTAVSSRFVPLSSRRTGGSSATATLTGQVIASSSQNVARQQSNVSIFGSQLIAAKGALSPTQAITNTPPVLVSPIPDFQLARGSTYSIADHFSDPGDTLNFSLAQGTLPAGVTFDTHGLFSATLNAALALSDSFIVKADDGQSFASDPKPFKLFRSGVQIREAVALYHYTDEFYLGNTGQAPLQPFDVIKVAPGNYTCRAVNWFSSDGLRGNPDPGTGKAEIMVDNITVEWLVPGQRPVINHAGASTGDNSFFICMSYTCKNLVVRGLDVTGPYAQTDDNQADLVYVRSGITAHDKERSLLDAIPYTLLVEDCAMRGFTFGMSTSANVNGAVTVRRCVIECDVGGGGSTLPHGIYFGEIASMRVEGCLFRRLQGIQSDAGHLLKSRAAVNEVHGNFFDGRNAGIARCIGIECGGVFNCTGNIFMHGEADDNIDANGPIAYGLEQQFPNGGMVYDNRVNTVLLAQNTIWWNQRNGYGFTLLRTGILDSTPLPATYWDAPARFDSYYPMIRAPQLPGHSIGNARGGTSNTIQLEAIAPTMPIGSRIYIRQGLGGGTGGSHRVIAFDDVNKIATVESIFIDTGHQPYIPDTTTIYELISQPQPANVQMTVRNNIVASALNDTFMGAQEFVATYPNNSRVNLTDINTVTGALILPTIPGNPLVNDATMEFAGEFQQPRTRTDTNRGGRP